MKTYKYKVVFEQTVWIESDKGIRGAVEKASALERIAENIRIVEVVSPTEARPLNIKILRSN